MIIIDEEYHNEDPCDDDITDIQDAPVCPDFDEDCADIESPEHCMTGGNTMNAICGICIELQRRQVKQ